MRPNIAEHYNLIPAYGRDYTSAEAVKADYAADKDFALNPAGPYTNRADLIRLGVKTVTIYYDRCKQAVSIIVQAN
jgi:hypothetical protein